MEIAYRPLDKQSHRPDIYIHTDDHSLPNRIYLVHSEMILRSQIMLLAKKETTPISHNYSSKPEAKEWSASAIELATAVTTEVALPTAALGLVL